MSTQAINLFYDSQLPIAAERPAYSLTKNAGTLTAQLIANGAPPDKLQVVSYHPGVIYSNAWKLAGAPADALPFDDREFGPQSVCLEAAEPDTKVKNETYTDLAMQKRCRARLRFGPPRRRPGSSTVGSFGPRGMSMSWPRGRSGSGLMRMRTTSGSGSLV